MLNHLNFCPRFIFNYHQLFLVCVRFKASLTILKRLSVPIFYQQPRLPFHRLLSRNSDYPSQNANRQNVIDKCLNRIQRFPGILGKAVLGL